jgi:hypothetical protein
MEIPYPSSVQVEYGMELEDDTVQWALHVSQAGRKGEGKGTYACAAWPGCAAVLGQTTWPAAEAASQQAKPKERELCLFFLNLRFSLKTILKQFDLGAKTNQHDKSKCIGMYASTCF